MNRVRYKEEIDIISETYNWWQLLGWVPGEEQDPSSGCQYLQIIHFYVKETTFNNLKKKTTHYYY